MRDEKAASKILGLPPGDPTIEEYLNQEGAVLTNGHFIYTGGMHGTAYINMRAVAQDAYWLQTTIGGYLGTVLNGYGPGLVIGPEALGRNLAQVVGSFLKIPAIWCDVDETDGNKRATFSPKFGFGRLVRGKRVVIVDDLLTTGSSIKLVSRLVADSGGNVVAAGVVVRRSPEVTAWDCDVPELRVLVDVDGFEVFTPKQCAERGPCSKQVPVVLRPGHGYKWVLDHPRYPVAS